MDVPLRVSHTGRMSDPGKTEGLRVEWSDDFKKCTASAADARGTPVSLTFTCTEPVACPLARSRMENAAAAAVRAVLEPDGA